MEMLLDGVSNADVHVILVPDQEILVLNVKGIQHSILLLDNVYSICNENQSPCSILTIDHLTLPMNEWESIKNIHLLSM